MAHDTAVKQGNRLESVVESFLLTDLYINLESKYSVREKQAISHAIDYESALSMCKNISINKPFFLKQFNLLTNIYQSRWKIDYFFWHPETFPKGAAMEVKQQSTAGSVDEKFPFVVASLKAAAKIINGPTAVFVSGGGVRQCAVEWCKSQEDESFVFIGSDAELRYFLKNGRKKGLSNNRNIQQKEPSLF